MIKWLITLIIVLLFSTALAVAGGFWGLVTDANDNPAGGAYVKAHCTDSTGIMVDDYADSAGYYYIDPSDGLFQGNWKLQGQKGDWISSSYGPHYWGGSGWIRQDIKLDKFAGSP
jgi:hypothetical protein